jgi:D-aminoacyl-tRNA deacylase
VRALVQRVARAAVRVDGETVGSIGAGMLVLLGVTHDDDEAACDRLADKVAALRIFGDEEGRMNEALGERREILVVSQFTLYGDARKGRRPTWAAAAPGSVAEPLVDALVTALADLGVSVQTGVFGADMRVGLVNDGPITVLLEA